MGNSAAVWVAPERVNRSDRTYGEFLEALLAERGFTCCVTTHARWNAMLPRAVCLFDSAVRADSPDVVVLHYGAIEAFPAVVPIRVHDYLHTWHVHAGFGRTRVRTALRRLLWNRLRRWQTFAAARLGPRTHHMGPRRFTAELTHLLDDIYRDQKALTLVIGIARPTSELGRLVPGVVERIQRYNQLMAQVCAARPAGTAIFIDLFDLADEPSLVPDGLHLSAEAHREVAGWLSEQIESWVARQSGSAYSSTVPS